MTATPPLGVYIVWHADFEQGTPLAESLFRALCADERVMTARNLLIPVRFRTAPRGIAPPPIDFGAFEQSAIFVLYDVATAADDTWRTYLDDIADSAPSHARIVPICFTRTEHLPPVLAATNAIRVEGLPQEDWWPTVRNRVLHALCQLLDAEGKQVLVFLSHAKADGREIATTIKAHLDGREWLDNFFDEADIPDGSSFADVILEAADTAPVLLAIQTDGYSSREWCRLEVLEAKRRGVPVVVLSAVATGEDRAFPYLGNTPVLRWGDPPPLPDLVGILLRQVLRRRFFPLRVGHVARLRGEPAPETRAEPPELLTALLDAHDPDHESHCYVYPDPPLGTEEIDLLSRADPRHLPLTPTTWWAS